MILALALSLAVQDALPKNPGKEPLAVPGAETGSAHAVADLAAADPALAALMVRLEGAVTLPAAARPLADHARYYAWADGPRSKVAAVYVIDDAPGRKWVSFDDLPDIAAMGSGCNAIALVYDVRGNRIDEIGCAIGA